MSLGIETLKRENLAFLRAKAQALVEQVRADERVRSQAASDPSGTLSVFGFSNEARHLWEARTNFSEVQYECCGDGTCAISWCPSTCGGSIICIATDCITTNGPIPQSFSQKKDLR